jgi:predicted MFS family arabinose efflux permease
MQDKPGKGAMQDNPKAGWLVVVGSTIALVVGNGAILFFTFGVFLKPITEQMGWHRGTMSLGVAIGLTIGGLVTPLVGQFIDKWGVQRVTLLAVTLFAASVASISLANSVAMFVLLYAISGLLSSGHAPLPYSKAITAWFDGRRGLALGIAMAGVGIGAALMPQIASLLVKAFGWRDAYIALGVLTWLIAFPAVLLFVKEPSIEKDGKPAHPSVMLGDEVRAALRRREFWLMAAAVLLVVTAINGTIAHLVALLSDRGMPSATATRMLIGVGLSTILGRLISGYFLDRVFAPYLAAAIFLVPLVGMLILWSGAASPALALLAAICFGFGLGAEVDVIGFLVGRYFGLRRYGQIYGYMFAIFTIGAGVGPYLMGLSFDATHSYSTALVAFSAMLVVSSAVISRLGPYNFPARGDEDSR